MESGTHVKNVKNYIEYICSEQDSFDFFSTWDTYLSLDLFSAQLGQVSAWTSELTDMLPTLSKG